MKFWWTQIRELKAENQQLHADTKHLHAVATEQRNLRQAAQKQRCDEINARKESEGKLSSVMKLSTILLDRMDGVAKEDKDRVKLEIEEAISGLSEQHPVWLAINKLLARQIHVEHIAARQVGITNDDRNLNLGRECGLEDFRSALLQIFSRTRKK